MFKFGQLLVTDKGALSLHAGASNYNDDLIHLKPYSKSLPPNWYTTSGYYNRQLLKELELTPENAAEVISFITDTSFSVRSYSAGITGTDPEIFAFDSKGHLIPAWMYLKSGSKDSNAIGSVYWDGVQAEFNPEARFCHSQLTDRVHNCLKLLYNTLKTYDPTAELECWDVVKVPKTVRDNADLKYIELGCSPSENAYGIPPIRIANARRHLYRYSGMHLHFSSTFASEFRPKPSWFPQGTVVMLDKIAGLIFTALGRDLEDPQRRKAYGRPGEYRLQKESIMHLEYRTPSSYLLHSPQLFNFACDMGRQAYRMGLFMDGNLCPIEDVSRIILESDADSAAKVILKHKQIFTEIFDRNYGPNAQYNAGPVISKQLFDILEKGAKASGIYTGTVADNWKIKPTDTYIPHADTNKVDFCRMIRGMK